MSNTIDTSYIFKIIGNGRSIMSRNKMIIILGSRITTKYLMFKLNFLRVQLTFYFIFYFNSILYSISRKTNSYTAKK